MTICIIILIIWTYLHCLKLKNLDWILKITYQIQTPPKYWNTTYLLHVCCININLSSKFSKFWSWKWSFVQYINNLVLFLSNENHLVMVTQDMFVVDLWDLTNFAFSWYIWHKFVLLGGVTHELRFMCNYPKKCLVPSAFPLWGTSGAKQYT